MPGHFINGFGPFNIDKNLKITDFERGDKNLVDKKIDGRLMEGGF